MEKAQLLTYLKDLAAQRGFDEARTGRLLGIIEGEGDVTLTRAEMAELLVPVVEHPFSRQAAFSKAMDDGAAKIKKYEDWYPQASAAANAALEEAKTSKAALARYEKLYGPIDDIEDVGDGKGKTPSGAIVDMRKVDETIDQKLQGWGRDTMRLVLDQSELNAKHWDLFKRPLNVAPLLKKVAEHQTNGETGYDLNAAYDEQYGTEIKAINDKAQIDRDNAIADKARLEERTRLMAGSRNGAAVKTQDGAFWNKVADDEKKAGANLSADERQTAFLADLNTQLAKNEQGTEA